MRQQFAGRMELCAFTQEPTQVPMRDLGTKSGRSDIGWPEKEWPSGIPLKPVGFQGESRRQERLYKRVLYIYRQELTSISQLTTKYTVEEKNAPTIRWQNGTLRFHSRTNTSTNERSRNQIRKIG